MVDSRKHPLALFERLALTLMRQINTIPLAKKLQHAYLSHGSQRLVYRAVGRRLYTEGLAELRGNHANNILSARSVILAGNHRTFFDLWVATLPVFRSRPRWLRRAYFPVRSEFFYETLSGVVVNLAAGGGCMYPPIFRTSAKSQYTNESLAHLATTLSQPGTLVGFHPEGTRNKSDDPYHLLPANPGLGKLILATKPLVIPFFINGLSNQLIATLKANRVNIRDRCRNPLIVIYGPPVDYRDFLTAPPRLALYKGVADRVHAKIRYCGERERVIRRRIAEDSTFSNSGCTGEFDGWYRATNR